MEEIRYYEAVLRFRESQSLSYLVHRAADRAGLKSFAESLNEIHQFSRLGKGESAAILEVHRGETNEFRSVMDFFSDLAKTVRGPGAGVKEDPPAARSESSSA